MYPDLSKVTVHSSPYAGPIYLKLGFNRIGNVLTEHGITCIPMELLFQEKGAHQRREADGEKFKDFPIIHACPC